MAFTTPRWTALFGLVLCLTAAPAATQSASKDKPRDVTKEGQKDVPKEITIAWDAIPEPGVLGYIVHVGTQSGSYTQSFDVGPVTSFTYTQGYGRRKYYFAIAAYTTGKVQGRLSSEISVEIDAAKKRAAKGNAKKANPRRRPRVGG